MNEAYTHNARHGKGPGPNHGHGRGRANGRDYCQERNSSHGVNNSSNKKEKKERMRNVKQLGKVVFDVVEEVIMHVIVVLPNTWLSFIKNH